MKDLLNQWRVRVISCFKRSIVNNLLRYTTYIGDGHSSSYNSLVKADPYPGFEIVKDESVGHIQKRVGSQCRNLKKKWAPTKMGDGKTINGIGKLTTAVINKM